MNYTLSINDFEGPLDLLLHLVRVSKMDIYEISIYKLIKDYLDFLETMQELDIDIASEYLEMASELVHLKSKMLLNKKEETEVEEASIKSEEDLRRKLVEYESIKNLTSEFKSLEEKRGEYYTKLPSNLKEYIDRSANLPSNMYDKDILYKAMLEVQRKLFLLKPLDTTITKKEYSITKRTEEIRNILSKNKRVEFTNLFDIDSKDYIIITFLTILNMSKNKELSILQSDNFSPIYLERVEL